MEVLGQPTKHHKIPWIANGILYLSETYTETIEVGSPEWYDWLGKATSFAYSDPDGNFTARLEKTRNGKEYWKAYRRYSGKLHSQYLGHTAELTLDFLNSTAKKLSPKLSIQNQDLVEPPPVVIKTRRDFHPITKFFIPFHPADILHRPRLFDTLRNPYISIVWIDAPPGYGKTSLVADWIRTSQYPAAWVSLEKRDDDPIRFWSAIIMALDSIHPGLTRHSLDFISRLSSHPPDHDFVPSLINDLEIGLKSPATPGQVILVLDDFQNIENPKIHNDLSAFIIHAPDQLRLVVMSNNRSPLRLGYVRIQDRLAEVGMDVMAFTRAEVEEYVRGTVDPDISTEIIDGLMYWTEGCIGAIHLAVQAAQLRNSKRGLSEVIKNGFSDIRDALYDEILSHQPEPVKKFLTITSILDRFTVDLCDKLIDEEQRRKGDPLFSLEHRSSSSSQAILEYLVNHNMFLIPEYEEGIWFRYHRLFAQYLRLQMKSDKHTSRLHRIAARWFAEHNDYQDAIQQAISGHDKVFTAALIEKYGPDALNQEKYQRVRDWLKAIPPNMIKTNPNLCFLQAVNHIGYGALDQARADLDNLENVLNKKDRKELQNQSLHYYKDILGAYLLASFHDDIPSAFKRIWDINQHLADDQYQLRYAMTRALLDIYLRFDSPSKAEETALDLVALSQKIGNRQRFFGAVSDVSNTQLILGRLKAAWLTLEQADRQATFLNAEQPFTEETGLVAARIAYEQNNLEKAWEEISQVMVPGWEDNSSPVKNGQVLFKLCQLHMARGEFVQAHKALDRVDMLFDSLDHHLTRPLAAWRTAVWLKQVMVGENADYAMTAAQNWAEIVTGQNQAGEKSVLHETIWPTHIILASVRLAEGNSEAASHLVETLRAKLEAIHAVGRLIQVLALQSIILESCDQHSKALHTLLKGLTLIEPEGFVRSFIDWGPPMANLLISLREEWKLPLDLSRYVNKLLKSFTQAGLPSTASPENIPAVHLTTTEMMVLRMLSEGYSNADIARELFVSENTAKTHIGHILKKLNANRRSQAVYRASKLSIL